MISSRINLIFYSLINLILVNSVCVIDQEKENVENKCNEVWVEPMFEQNCRKIENFPLTIAASLGGDNVV